MNVTRFLPLILTVYGSLLLLVLLYQLVRSAVLLVRRSQQPPPNRGAVIPASPPRWMVPPPISWEEAEPLMGSGDVLLVHSDTLAARVVCVFGRCWFSHAALVVRRPSPRICDAYGCRDVVSVSSPLCVLECDAPRLALMTLADWRRKYHSPDASCVWRKVCCPRRTDGVVAVHGAGPEAWEPVVERLCGAQYPTALQMWFHQAALPGATMPPAGGPAGPRHCVETVCEVLRAIGALSEGKDTRHWCPDDLAANRWQAPVVDREFELSLALLPPPAATTPPHHDDKEGQLGVQHDGKPDGDALAPALHVDQRGIAPGAGGVPEPDERHDPQGQASQGVPHPVLTPQPVAHATQQQEGQQDLHNAAAPVEPVQIGHAAPGGHLSAIVRDDPHAVVPEGQQEQLQPKQKGDGGVAPQQDPVSGAHPV